MGEKSLEAARKIEDISWQLNASILVAQSVLRSGHADAALLAFERCIDVAEVKEDEEAKEKLLEAMDSVKAVIAARDEEDRIAKERRKQRMLERKRSSIHVDAGDAFQGRGDAPPHHLNKAADLPEIAEDEEE